LNNALPGIALTSVAIIMVLLVVGAFGKNLNIENGNAGGIFVWFSIGAVGLIFAISAGWIRNLPYWLDWLRYGYNQTLIVSLLVLGAVIWFIVRDPNPEPSNDDDISFGDLLEDRDS
jgi:amino acid transporter